MDFTVGLYNVFVAHFKTYCLLLSTSHGLTFSVAVSIRCLSVRRNPVILINKGMSCSGVYSTEQHQSYLAAVLHVAITSRHFAFTVSSLLSLLWRNESRFMRSSSSVCLCILPSLPNQLLNGWTSFKWNLVCISWHPSPSQRRAS
jgi:hypothetical protein